MSLREFLARWLRGLRATAVTVDEALTQRRLHARLDAEWEREAAEYEADLARVRELMARLVPPVPVSLEGLMLLPTVEPDRSEYARPAADSVDDAVRWLYGDRERGWWDADANEARQCALLLLAIRERVTGVRLP